MHYINIDGEELFEDYCNDNKINFEKIDGNKILENKYLNDTKNEKVDYVILSNTEPVLFVEIKTHILHTNKKREEIIKNKSKEQKISVYSPKDDLGDKGPFVEYLKKSKKQFSNVKSIFDKVPRCLIICSSSQNNPNSVRSLFAGVYRQLGLRGAKVDPWTRPDGSGLLSRKTYPIDLVVLMSKTDSGYLVNGVENVWSGRQINISKEVLNLFNHEKF